MPSSPDRNEATSADSAVTNSLPYAVGMRSPLYRCCCGSCWSRQPDLPTPRHGIGAVAVEGTVYVMSGGPTPGGSQTPYPRHSISRRSDPPNSRRVDSRIYRRAAHGQNQRVGKGWGRRRVLIAAVIAALVVVPAALVISQQRASSASTILSILDGTASVARGAAAFVSASDGDIVTTGDRVQTADRSHAMVSFFDGSTLEIEPATTVQIEEAQGAASGAIAIRIAQTLGRTWASVQKLTRVDSKFEIRTPTLTAAVRGTGFIIEVLADGTSSVQTTDGTVQVTAQGQTVSVGAGQTTIAPPNGPPSAPASSPASPNLLRFGMHSPAYLAVVDPFGRACGVVLPGPTVVRQIPRCLASDPGTEPQLVDLPSAMAGTYQVVVAAIAPGGAFTATASAVDGLGNLSFNYLASGSGETGAKYTTRIVTAAASYCA